MSEPKKPRKTSKKGSEDSVNTDDSKSSATSKPVLITNRPIMKKPADTGQSDEADEEGREEVQPIKLGSSSKAKLQPLEDSSISDESAATGQEEDRKEAAAKETDVNRLSQEEEPGKAEDNVAAEATPASTTAGDQKSSSGTSEATPSSSVAESSSEAPAPEPQSPSDDKQKSPAAKQAEVEAAEQAQRDETVQKLVESKRYFLPINAVEKRKTKRFVVIGVVLSLILVFCWIDIALDAGILHLGGLQPLTHFFSN